MESNVRITFDDKNNMYHKELFLLDFQKEASSGMFEFPLSKLPHAVVYLPLASRSDLFAISGFERATGGFDEGKGILKYSIGLKDQILSGEIKSTAFFNTIFGEKNIIENTNSWVKYRPKEGGTTCISVSEWWRRSGTQAIIVQVFLFLLSKESEHITVNYNPKIKHENEYIPS